MTEVEQPATDQSLRARMQRVIPGGMYGHMNAAAITRGWPQFMAGGRGSKLTDVDGRQYIDLMCGWGPIVLGRQHPPVDEAVRRVMAEGDCLNGPSPVMADLAEVLVDIVPHADWTLFAKNGSDATTACVTIARAATGRRKVLLARGAYHGSLPWCTPLPGGVVDEDRAHLLYFDYNDIGSFDRAVAVAGADFAAVMVSPVRQELATEQVPASLEFATHLRRVCTDRGALLILDDVRCGFRIDLAGSWEPLGVQPDLAAWSKAIANGYPLSAVTGIDAVRDAVPAVYLTGSFWFSAAPMAAALATITELRETDALLRIEEAGQALQDGLNAQVDTVGLAARCGGPPQMPLLVFDGEDHARVARRFADACIGRGVYLHPVHNWFLSAAHTSDDVAAVLEVTEEALRLVAAEVS